MGVIDLKTRAYCEAIPTEAKTPDGKSAVDMKFTISEIGKDGKRNVVAQPEVLVLDGETAKVFSGREKRGVSYTHRNAQNYLSLIKPN